LFATFYAKAESHCKKEETTYFSCQIERSPKTVSLCGSSQSEFEGSNGLSEGWLQYRFGRLGAPEFTFPATKESSTDKFHGFWSLH
jgi:hypothetical protein